jgi:hypothetical protein
LKNSEIKPPSRRQPETTPVVIGFVLVGFGFVLLGGRKFSLVEEKRTTKIHEPYRNHTK